MRLMQRLLGRCRVALRTGQPRSLHVASPAEGGWRGDASLVSRRSHHPLLWLPLALLLSACTGLAGEVVIVATATPQPTAVPVVADRGYPAQPPNLAEGQRLYALHCTACHAADGSGRGELVLSGQVSAMQSFLDADAMRSKTPAQYFDIITNGNLAKLMPPWKDAFTEQQRWDVAHYVLFMHYTPEQIALGQQLYAQHCADCHGEAGRGDGARQLEIGGKSYNLTYPRDMAFISDADLVAAMREGRGDAMPMLEAAVSDEEAFAIAAYIRTFSTVNDPAAAQAEPAFDANAFTISGRVVNGTTGQPAPQGLPVYLNYGSTAAGLNTLQTTVGADGRYAFEDVPRLPESAYFVYTLYSGVTFDGGVRRVEEVGAALDVPLSIFETTDDLSIIRLTKIDTVMQPFASLAEQQTSGLLVTQNFTFENSGDRAFVLSQAGRTFSVLLTMPPGSIALNALNDRRFIVAQEQFAVIYAMGLPPGETRVELIYFWPYEDGAVFDQALNYAYAGEVTLTVSPKSLALRDATGWTVDTSAPFVNQYRRTVNIPRGGSLVLDLTGSLTPTVGANVVTADVLLPLLAVIGALTLLGLAAFLLIKQRSTPGVEALLQQIAQLDALHERGQINHDAYQRQRKALKEQVAVLMAAQRPPATSTSNDE